MLILNACKDIKVQFSDEETRLVFSPRILTKQDAVELCENNGVLMDKKVDHFLSSFTYSIIRSEDKSQIYAVEVDADESVCKEFLGDLLRTDAKVLLQDE